MNTPAENTVELTAAEPQQTYAQLIDALATTVFIGFIERGRASLSTSANSMLSAGYTFLQRVHPSPWPKDPETLAILKRDIQIALLDGLIREGMPGVRSAVMQSYEQMAQAADKRSLALQNEESASISIVQPAPPVVFIELPLVAAASVTDALPEPTLVTTASPKNAPTSREEVLLNVRKTVAEHLNKDIEPITMDTTFVADLGADSLDLVELVMMLEDRLGIEMKDEDAQQLSDIRHAVDMVCVRLGLPMEDAQPEVIPTASVSQ